MQQRALFPYNGTCHVNCSAHELSVACIVPLQWYLSCELQCSWTICGLSQFSQPL